MVYTIINLFAPFGTQQINDIHFKWTRPDAYICSASAQKAELNVVGVLEVNRGKCASLYTGSSIWDGLVVVWGVSVDITHSSFRACMYWHGILQGTRAWRYNYHDGAGAIGPENFDTIPS